MSICVPKHIVCDWYTPVFVPGNAGCSLPIHTEEKSRLLIGGSFFRSKDVGFLANDIQVASEWQVDDGGWRAYNASTDTLDDVKQVELTVTDGIITEPYYVAAQEGSIGSPTWISSGISSLRSQLATSVLIEMPTIDLQTPGTNPGDDTWNSALDDDDHLEQFSLTNLTGGNEGPITQAGLNNIRTGPSFSMVYISSSEINNSTGILEDVNETRYWNGSCYKGYSSIVPDCEDPTLSTGSPPTGSPLFCELGPSSNCP